MQQFCAPSGLALGVATAAMSEENLHRHRLLPRLRLGHLPPPRLIKKKHRLLAPAPGARCCCTCARVKNDPSGANTGVASDIVGGSANAPTQEELDKLGKTEPLAAKVADVVGHNRISINMVWTLVCGFLVMFMQAGFAMVETGFTRAKNAGHTMAMNFMVYALGMLGYWICGFALQMGGVGAVAALGGANGAQ